MEEVEQHYMRLLDKDSVCKEVITGRDTARIIILWTADLLFWFGPLFRVSFLPSHFRTVSWLVVAPLGLVALLFDRTLYYSYGISDRGITEYRFRRKRREILWDMVKQIGLQKDSQMVGGSPAIIVTLQGADCFPNDKKRGSRRYYQFWWPDVLLINPSQRARKIIEEFYGPFDY